jgi:protein SSD1
VSVLPKLIDVKLRILPTRVTDEVKPQFAGHVVAVVERMPGQLFSGTLGLLRPSSAATKEKQEAERREREGDRGDEPRRGPIERPKIVWFKPTDKRVPLIAIPTEQAPPDFVQNSEAYVDKLFVACIKRHVSSLPYAYVTNLILRIRKSPSVLCTRSAR